jgi:hypothetical protein
MDSVFPRVVSFQVSFCLPKSAGTITRKMSLCRLWQMRVAGPGPHSRAQMCSSGQRNELNRVRLKVLSDFVELFLHRRLRPDRTNGEHSFGPQSSAAAPTISGVATTSNATKPLLQRSTVDSHLQPHLAHNRTDVK